MAFSIVAALEPKSCSYERDISASGPTTFSNTFSYSGTTVTSPRSISATAQSTVTILGPCERDETEPDECNEDPRDAEDLDDADDSEDTEDSGDPAEEEDEDRPDPDHEEPTRPRGDASAEGDDTDHEDPDDD